MAKTKSEQARELANCFLSIAQALGDFRIKNYQTLSKADDKKLSDLHWSILNYVDDLTTQSAITVLDEAGESIKNIQAVTKKMEATYKKLENVQKGIQIASKVIVLGAAIISKNPGAIVTSLGDLVGEVSGE